MKRTLVLLSLVLLAAVACNQTVQAPASKPVPPDVFPEIPPCVVQLGDDDCPDVIIEEFLQARIEWYRTNPPATSKVSGGSPSITPCPGCPPCEPHQGPPICKDVYSSGYGNITRCSDMCDTWFIVQFEVSPGCVITETMSPFSGDLVENCN